MRAIGVFGTVRRMSALRLWWSRLMRLGAGHGSFFTWIHAAASELLVHTIVEPDWLTFASTMVWLKTSENLSNGEEKTRERAEISWTTRHGLPMGRGGDRERWGRFVCTINR
jgi:hypothetical protein